MPKGYKDWKARAVGEIRGQMGVGGFPIQRAELEMELHGSSGGDPDNMAGGVLDALVEAGVLEDDRMKNLPRMLITYHPGGRRGAVVRLTVLST